jgi:hypothetical protein
MQPDAMCRASINYACDSSLAQAVSSVHERGFAVIPNFLCSDEVQCMRQVSRNHSEERSPLTMSLSHHASPAVCGCVYTKMFLLFPGMRISLEGCPGQ